MIPRARALACLGRSRTGEADLSRHAPDAKSSVVLRPLGATLLLLTLTAACATQADLQQLRREDRTIRGQLADTRASVESMQRDVAALRGKLDETRHSSGGGRELGGRLDSLDARVTALEQARTGAVSTEISAVPPAPAPSPAPGRTEVAASDLAREEAQQTPDEYRRALAFVRQNEYDRAVQLFREFLRTNPNSPLAPNAHYWIGECYFVLGDYSQAILQFNDVRQQYPKSDRVPPALLKIGLAFLEMGNKSEARLAFQKIVNDYPSSPEAVQAREKLRALGA
jgi:tol-pal system protein YbgF